MGRTILSCLLAGLAWASMVRAEPPSPSWTWTFAASYVPKFEGKEEQGKGMLVVEIAFQNRLATAQKLVMAQEGFGAVAEEATPVTILGLLFRMDRLEGAKSMTYTGGMKRMETLNELQADSSAWFFNSPGPVEVVVEPGRSYTQRLLLTKPNGGKPFRLTFSDLPALEIRVPR